MRKGTIIFYKVEYKQTIPSDYKLVLKYMESTVNKIAAFIKENRRTAGLTQEEFADDVIRAAMVLQSMPEELRRVAVEQVRILNGLTFN